MKRFYCLLFLLSSSLLSVGLSTEVEWAKVNGGIQVFEIKMDSRGYVYTIGNFKDTADFKPGPGIFHMTSNGGTDIFINKFSQDGDLIWAKSFGGIFNDKGAAIELDQSNNILVSGHFGHKVDFDPGPDTFFMTSAGAGDIFISKLDQNGKFIWAKQFTGRGNEVGNDIAVGPMGNIVTTGYFNDTVDFDPGPGLHIAQVGNPSRIFISMLDPLGNFKWVASIGGGQAHCQGNEVYIDRLGQVHATGFYQANSSLSIDFDPGPDTFLLDAPSGLGHMQTYVLKLSSNGAFVWARGMGGSGNDEGNRITVDADGNVYTAGGFDDIGDFDPGPSEYILGELNEHSTFVSKLDINGNFVWAIFFNSDTSGFNEAEALLVDDNKNVYVGGRYHESLDCDPGPGEYILWGVKQQIASGYIVKLNSNAEFIWAGKFTDRVSFIGHAGVNSFLLDEDNYLYSVGSFYGTVDFHPDNDALWLYATDVERNYMHKMNGLILDIGMNLDGTISKPIVVYPSPCISEFTVESKSTIRRIEIFQMNGKLLKEIEPNKALVKIEVKNFKPSIYAVRVFMDEGVYTERIVVTQ